MHRLHSSADQYTPSCNWRNLQKRLQISDETIKNPIKKPMISDDLNNTNSVEGKDNVLSESFFFFSKTDFNTQIDKSKKYSLKPIKELNNLRKTRLGRYIAMDCEMVQVGPRKKDRCLARISIVNYYGSVIFDTFVKPKERVVDYKTWIHGITSTDLEKAPSLEDVQEETAKLLKDRILVGHAVKNDLDVLFLSHPKKNIRDTSKFKTFKAYSNGKTPSLKKLAKEILNMNIQCGIHSSIEDARVAMMLYRRYKTEMDRH